ncbi:MAG TPA: hypothetical protein VK175_01740 [Leadbetterella sp.]|nr:hypothetical protein [Leadbetterella sp.]
MKVLNIFSIFAFLLFVVAYSYDASLNFQNFPISDDYEAFFDFNNKYLAATNAWDKLKLIFSQHNEHRIATLRLINLAYLSIFHQVDLQVFRVIGLVFYLLSMAFLYFEGGFNYKRFYFFLPVPILMLSFAFAEIYFLAMESLSHFPMVFFTVGTIYLAINRKYTTLPIIFLFFGVFSNGNGILLMPLVFFGMLLQKEYRRSLIWAAASICISIIYFIDYEAGKTGLSLSILPYLLKVYPIYLGGIGGFGSIKVNLILGVFALLWILYFVFFKNIIKRELSLTLMLVFYLLTFLIISVKRNEYGEQLLQRGAYLINSVLVFVVLYIIYFKQILKAWKIENSFKKVGLFFGIIIIGGFGYQVKNYRTWIQILKYDEIETRHDQMMYLGNTTELYQDHNRIYNIPLVSDQRIDELRSKGVFDLEKVKRNVVAVPMNNTELQFVKALKTETFEVHKIAGFDIKENPYVKIKGVYKGVFKATDLELGVAIESDGKKYYFRIPRLRSHLNFFEKAELQEISFDCLLLKKYLSSNASKITIFKFEDGKQVLNDKWSVVKNPIDYDEYNANSKVMSLTDSEKFKIDTVSRPILEEAFSLNNFHEIVLNLQNLKNTNASSKYYLIFHGLDGGSFLSVLKPFNTENKKGVFYTKFEFEQVEKYLKKKNSVFKLDLLVNTNGKMTVSHLKSVYYFYSKNKGL